MEGVQFRNFGLRTVMKNLLSYALSGFIFASLAISLEAVEVKTTPIPFDGKRARAVTAPDGTSHVIYNNMGNIFYTTRAQDSSEFSKPIQVNSIDKSAAIADISLGKNGSVHVFFHGNIFYIRDQIKSENRRLKATDIKYAFYTRLNDAGDAFEPQREVAGGVWGFDGGCTLSADDSGNIYLFVGGTVKQGKEQERQVFMRHSKDNGETFSEPSPIDLGMGVCACCHLESQIGPKGELMVAYRVAEGGVDRDSYVLVSQDNGTSFSKTSLDNWKLRACPGSAYSFTTAGGNSFVSWRNKDEIYLKLNDSPDSFTPPNRKLKRRAAVLASNKHGDVLLAWAEGENFNKPHHLQWQLFNKEGKPMGEVGGLKDAFQRWGMPAVISDANGDFIVLH